MNGYKIPLHFADRYYGGMLDFVADVDTFGIRQIKSAVGGAAVLFKVVDYQQPCMEVRFFDEDNNWVEVETFFRNNISASVFAGNQDPVKDFKLKLLNTINQYIRDINNAKISVPSCEGDVIVQNGVLYAPVYSFIKHAKVSPPDIESTTLKIFELTDIDFRDLGWER